MPTMLAAVLHDVDDLRLDRVPVPEPATPGSVLVRIHSCGICQTDYKAIRGIRTNVSFPIITGHEPSGTVAAVRPMLSLRRRGTRCNLFGITTHETFELDGGYSHFLEARIDASFGTTPHAMSRALRLMERGLVDPERTISHRFPLTRLHDALSVMDRPDRNKVMIHPTAFS